MKKIKTINNWIKETNPENYQNCTSPEAQSAYVASLDEVKEWGYITLKYDNPADVSYSQSFQDLFVISVLDGKRNGTFIDLGCSYPISINNTYLLESDFGWSGVAIDIDADRTSEWKVDRNCDVITFDAGNIDYNDLLSQFDSTHIDYLSIDVDNDEATYFIIDTIDFSKYEFSVITFEHNLYNTSDVMKNHMKDIMEKNGYILAVEDVCNMGSSNDSYQDPFEDWYINPKYVNEDAWKKYESKYKKGVDIFS
tara:strand:- start:675 stop:1433 length:759 start_codon:yes stop_codon:yes gene_type:complete